MDKQEGRPTGKLAEVPYLTDRDHCIVVTRFMCTTHAAALLEAWL